MGGGERHAVPPIDDGEAWDAIVVGTGMGGGACGYALAMRGWRVLFLERGPAATDAYDPQAHERGDHDERLRNGLWPERLRMTVDGRASDRFGALGCGVGGSTPFYGGALERFDRRDLEPSPGDPHPAGAWPLGYDAIAPFYAEAERLLRVKGTRDPLGDPSSPRLPRPPAAAAVDGELMRDFARAGLHPYRLHVGFDYVPGCVECVGRPCPIACKSDAANRFVLPAVATGGATLRTGCEVVRIESDGRTATGVSYRRDGTLQRARAPVVVLGAGTLRTPALLLASASPAHPAGLANSSGLVGRNLMFHASEWIALWPRRRASPVGPRKAIGLRDFYRHGGMRLGALQSVGLTAGYGNILMALYDWFDRSAWRRLRPLRPLLRIPARIAARLFGSAAIFALILEDLPYPDNRVELDPADPGRIVVHYRIPEELRSRATLARRLVKRALGLRGFWLRPELILDDGHPSGTCRFGNDPATSVLDRDCRAHDLDNLYVVDGSVLPSSAGINPSLTIAANALRVAAAIADRFTPAEPRAAAAA